MSLLFACKQSNKACPRSRAPYNRAHVSCPSGMARMSQLLNQFPCVPFEVEPSTHLFLAKQYLREAACLAYPPQTETIKKQGLSEQTIFVIRSKVRISNVCIRTSLFLRNASARACFYLWRGWQNDLSRTKYCAVRGFSRKALCMRQLFSRAAERSIRARLASLLELEHLAKLSAKADSAEGKVISEDPITLFRYVSPFIQSKQKSKNSTFIESAGCRAEHQSKFRAHVQNIMHACFGEKHGRAHKSHAKWDTKHIQQPFSGYRQCQYHRAWG